LVFLCSLHFWWLKEVKVKGCEQGIWKKWFKLWTEVRDCICSIHIRALETALPSNAPSFSCWQNGYHKSWTTGHHPRTSLGRTTCKS
jgi:hypothetical protein